MILIILIIFNMLINFFFHLSWLNVAYLHRQDLGLINLHYLRIIALVIIVLSRSQDGYCEYMADGTKALLLKKIFSEAEKVLQDYDDGHCT